MARWRRLRAVAAMAACLALVTCCLVVAVRVATLQAPDVQQLRLLRAIPGANESTLDVAVEFRGSLHGFGLSHIRAAVVAGGPAALPADCHPAAAAAAAVAGGPWGAEVAWYTCASAPSVPHATARGVAAADIVEGGGVVLSLVLQVDPGGVAGALSRIISAGICNDWVGEACLHAAVRGSVQVTPWLAVGGDYALALCARLPFAWPHVVSPEDGGNASCGPRGDAASRVAREDDRARDEPTSGGGGGGDASRSGSDAAAVALMWTLGPVRCRMTSVDLRRAFGTDHVEFEIVAEHDAVSLVGDPDGAGVRALSLRGRLGVLLTLGEAGGGDVGIEANMTHIIVRAGFDENAAHRVRRALLSMFAIDAGPLSVGPALVTWRGLLLLPSSRGLLQSVLDALKIDVPLTWRPPRACESALNRRRRVEALESASADWSLLSVALNVVFERVGLDSIETLVVSPSMSAGSDKSSGLVIAATLMLRKRLLPVRALDVHVSAPFDACLPTVSVGGGGAAETVAARITWCASSSMLIASTSLAGGGLVRVSANMSILPSSSSAAAGVGTGAASAAPLGNVISNLLGGGGPSADRRLVVAVPPSPGDPLVFRLLRGLLMAMPAQCDVVAAWEAMPDEKRWAEVAPPSAGAAGRVVMTFERSMIVPNIAFGAPRVDMGSAFLLVNSDAPRDVCGGHGAAYNVSAEADGGRLGVTAGVADYELLRFRAFMRVDVVLFEKSGRRGAATSQFVTGLLSRPTRVVLSGTHRGLSFRTPWVVSPICGPFASVGLVVPQLGVRGAYDVEVFFANALPVSLAILVANLSMVGDGGGDGWVLSGVPPVELAAATSSGNRCAASTTTVHASLQQLPSEAPLAAGVRAVLVGAVVVTLGGVVTTTVHVGPRGVPVCPWDAFNATAFARQCAAFGGLWYVRVDAAAAGGGTLPVDPGAASGEDSGALVGSSAAAAGEEGSCVFDTSQGIVWASCAPALAVGAALGTPLVCLCAARALSRLKERWRLRKTRGYTTVAQDEDPAAAIDTPAHTIESAAAEAAESDVTHTQLAPGGLPIPDSVAR